MAKRKDGNQIDNLTPDHEKLIIDLTPLHAGDMRHAIGKILMRAATSL
jgi:hypothetical protein